VKTRGDGKAESWLLFKGRDDAADDKLDIVAAQPASVVSGRTLDQIARAADRVWHTDRAAEPTAAERPAPRASVARPSQSRPAANHDELLALVEQLPLGFKLTNLGKVLYPDQGITKGELIAYLAVVADWMLPHVAHRPLTLVRCPEGLRPGRGKACFFQKHRLAGSPPSIDRVELREGDGAEAGDGEVATYMAVHDMPGLVALAQLGTLEIHTWGSHTDKPEKPDLMVFDLDPDVGLGWEKVALAAFELRRRLHDAGLESFVKTTGGKGLHVVAPVHRTIGWDDFKAFSRAVVEAVERDEPERYTTNMSKARRKGRIFLDYLRNGRGATFIAPYSPRARAGAPVAVPITWDELAHGIDPSLFTTATVPRRLAALRDDPWHAMTHVKQSITASAWRAVGGKRP
jgi:bifunctional non-homologous end joining protein LigD